MCRKQTFLHDFHGHQPSITSQPYLSTKTGLGGEKSGPGQTGGGWTGQPTGMFFYLYKWPFCMGQNGWGGGEIYTVFFWDRYMFHVRLAGCISFTKIGKPTWSQLKAVGQLYRPFPLLLCYCLCFLISLKFVWRWCQKYGPSEIKVKTINTTKKSYAKMGHKNIS